MVPPWLPYFHIISVVTVTLSGLPAHSMANMMPEFVPKEKNIILKLDEGPGTPVGRVLHKFKGNDWDGDSLTFTLQGEPESLNGPAFKIDKISRTEANLVLRRELDREEDSEYILQVVLQDGRSKKPATQNILIIVLDVNDNYPKFDKFNATFEIVENSEIPIVIANFHAEDIDEGPNGEVDYFLRFLDDSDQTLFDVTLEDDQAVVRLISPLDFEKKTKHIIQLVAQDSPSEGDAIPNETVVNITVNVIDASDSAPIFLERKVAIAEIPEDIPLSSQVVQIKAVDGDSGVNSSIYYELLNELDKFSMDPYSGVIKTRFRFNSDHDTVRVYRLRVKATETGVSQEVEISSKLKPSQTALWSETDVLVNVTEIWGSPHFRNETYVGHIPENSPPGYPVLMRKGFVTEAYDNDKGGWDWIKLTVEGDGDTFDVVPNEGYARIRFQIVVKNPLRLDYERLQEIGFHLIAEDSAGNRSRLLVSVFISDQNDNPPVFKEHRYFVKIPENPPPGLLVTKVTATDKDSGLYGERGLRYVSLRGLAEKELHLDDVSGEINVIPRETDAGATNSVFDRERNPEIYMTILVQDNMGNGNGDTAMLVIQLQDENDNSPQFLQSFYETEVYENQENISLSLRISAFDSDEPNTNNSKIRYKLISNANYGNLLSGRLDIDASSGVLFLRKSFDFEEIYHYLSDDHESLCVTSPCKIPVRLRIQASDLGNPPQVAQVPFTLFIVDKNDCKPEFTSLFYNVTVYEDLQSNQEITRITCIDRDASPDYKSIIYKKTGEIDEARRFVIDTKSGVVTLATGFSLDWNLQKKYEFHVGCVDDLNLKSERDAVVTVAVLDVNNKPPVFLERIENDLCSFNRSVGVYNRSLLIYYYETISENTPVNVNVTKVKASDPDSNAELRYKLNYQNSKGYKDGENIGAIVDLERYLVIDPVSGVITTGSLSFDYETVDSLKVEIFVEDIAGKINTPQLAKAWLSIDIENMIDVKPRFAQREYKALVKENSPIGTEIVTVNAEGDERVEMEYTVAGGENLPFKIGYYNGIIKVTGMIDREAIDWYNITVKATTVGNNLFSTVGVFIQVEDENDNWPVFTDHVGNVSVEENSPLGSIIARVQAIDKDGGSFGKLVYVLEGNSQPIFSIDNTSGIISLSGLLDREQRDRYELVVKAMDNFHEGGKTSGHGNSNSVTKIIYVNVKDMNDHAPEFHFLNNHETNVGSDSGHKYIVWENETENCPIFSFTLTDDDQQGTPNAALLANISHSDKDKPQLFKLLVNEEEAPSGSKIWTLYTARPLTGFSGNHTVILEAKDEGIPPNKAVQQVTILVKSTSLTENTVAFRFAQAQFTAAITLGDPEGTEILQVSLIGFQGVDTNSVSDNLKFSLKPASSSSKASVLQTLFAIHPTTGIISVGFKVTDEIYPKSYYRFIIIANWTADLHNNAYGTSAKLTIYRVASSQKVQLLSRNVLEISEERVNMYQLGKYLGKLFGLFVSVRSTVVTTEESTNVLLYEISLICPKTNQVLESSDIRKIMASAHSDISVIFKKFQVMVIDESDDDVEGVTVKKMVAKFLKFVFASQHEHLYTVSDASTLYLYLALLAGSVLFFQMAVIFIIIVITCLCTDLPTCVDLEEEEEFYYNNLSVLWSAEIPKEVKDLLTVQLDDDEDNEKPKESDC